MTPESRQHLERWAHAFLLVRSIPTDRRFNMHSWGERDTRSTCGTAACLAGHCGITPWFRREGFRLRAVGKSLKPDNAVTNHFDVGSYAAEFFGAPDSWDATPFAPAYCNSVLNAIFDEPDARLTPKRMARVVKYYMSTRWSLLNIQRAIKAAEETNQRRKFYSSLYNMDFVHKLLGWAT